MEKQRRLRGGHIVAIVGSVCAAVVLAPVGVMAATGSLVNITDPYNSRARARVDSGKVRVGDGNGALTVDGTVKTSDASVLLYQAPATYDCTASSAGTSLGTFDVSRYRALRLSVESSVNNQTIIAAYARAGTQVITKAPLINWTVPANQAAHYVLHDLPTKIDLRVWFCYRPKIFIYGIR